MKFELPKHLESCKKSAVNHSFDKDLTFQHSSILVSGGKIIGSGFNSHHVTELRWDRMLAIKARRLQNENHAEIAAIVKARGKFGAKKSLKGSTLYVARVHRNGDFAFSRPCVLCRIVIYNTGIRKVIYSIGPNEFGTWLPNKEKGMFAGVADFVKGWI